MKKTFPLILAIIMLLSILPGCKSESADKDASWAKNAVVYEIFVRSYNDGNGDGIGDFKGIINKVDYLKELGINAIWLMPIMESTTYHGYDVVNYTNVEPDYGNIDDFKKLIKVCHKNDIKVILDFVVNHTSSENEWFKQALTDENSKYREYYSISKEPIDSTGWRKDEATNQYYYGLYDKIMPDLNFANKNVCTDIKDAAKFWIDLGIDGFRLDGSNNIDTNPKITHTWWNDFSTYVKEKNPSVFIVGENWEGSMDKIAPYYREMDSSFNFETATIIEDMAAGANKDIIKTLNTGHELYQQEHNQSTIPTKIITDSVMINNHDMDRIATRLTSIDKAKLAASIQLTLPGTPFIYYGDELGQLGQKPDDNRREPFDWYKEAKGNGMTIMNDTFFNPSVYTLPNDGISYEEQKDNENSILNHYKKLIKLRNENPLFTTGKYSTNGMKDGLYSYIISSENNKNKIVVIHNQSDSIKSFELNVKGKDLYNNTEIEPSKNIKLNAFSSLILKYSSDEITPTNIPYEAEQVAVEQEMKVTIKLTLPENTPDENIYVVGTFNNWNPKDDNYIMNRTSPTTCEITFTVNANLNSKMEYKFTRGNWDKREINSEGKDLVGPLQAENRVYNFEEVDGIINATIEKWLDIK